MLLHLFNFDAFFGTYFDTAHTADAFPCLIWVCLAVSAHLIYTNRADIDTLSTAGAAIQIDIN